MLKNLCLKMWALFALQIAGVALAADSPLLPEVRGADLVESDAWCEVKSWVAVVPRSLIEQMSESLSAGWDGVAVMKTLSAEEAENAVFMPANENEPACRFSGSVRRMKTGQPAKLEVNCEIPLVVSAGEGTTAIEFHEAEIAITVNIHRTLDERIALEWEVDHSRVLGHEEGSYLMINGGMGGARRIDEGQAVLFAQKSLSEISDQWMVTILQPTVLKETESDAEPARSLRDDIQELHGDVRQLIELLRQRTPDSSSDNEADAQEGVSVEPGTRLLYFTAPWCRPSQQMVPLISKMQAEVSCIEELNVGDPPTLCKRFRIGRIPMFVKLKDGIEVERRTGKLSENQIRAMLMWGIARDGVDQSSVILLEDTLVARVNGRDLVVDDVAGGVRQTLNSAEDMSLEQKQKRLFQEIKKRLPQRIDEEVVLHAFEDKVPEEQQLQLAFQLESAFQSYIEDFCTNNACEGSRELEEFLEPQGMSIQTLRDSFFRIQLVNGFVESELDDAVREGPPGEVHEAIKEAKKKLIQSYRDAATVWTIADQT